MKKIEAVLNESKPTLVVFQHAGRQDSARMHYLIDDLRSTFNDEINVLTIDTSYDGKMSMRYKLEDYPTWILYKEGQELMRESGHKKEGDLVEMVRRAL